MLSTLSATISPRGEDRIPARAAAGDQYLGRSVVGQRRKLRERDCVTQFGIEGHRLLAQMHSHPPGVGILLVLVADGFRCGIRDRSQSFDALVQRLLLQRFANLLAHDLVDTIRLIDREQALCARQQLQRTISSHGEQEQRRYRRVRLQQGQ